MEWPFTNFSIFDYSIWNSTFISNQILMTNDDGNPLWLRCQCECTMSDGQCTLYVLHKYIFIIWSNGQRHLDPFHFDLMTIYFRFNREIAYICFFINFSLAIAICSMLHFNPIIILLSCADCYRCYLRWLERQMLDIIFNNFRIKSNRIGTELL